MTTVSILYHSGYGHTAEQAKAVQRGIETAGASALLVPVNEFDHKIEAVHGSDAIIFGSPTYIGTVSADFKKFMEDTSKFFMDQKWAGKLAAGFTNSASQNGDKLNTLQSLAIFAAQHGMLWVSLGLLPGNNHSKGSVEDLNRLGSFMGAMAQSNADQGPEHGPTPSDLKTAEHLGNRVAILATRHATKH